MLPKYRYTLVYTVYFTFLLTSGTFRLENFVTFHACVVTSSRYHYFSSSTLLYFLHPHTIALQDNSDTLTPYFLPRAISLAQATRPESLFTNIKSWAPGESHLRSSQGMSCTQQYVSVLSPTWVLCLIYQFPAHRNTCYL